MASFQDPSTPANTGMKGSVNGCDIEEESIEENHHVFLESFTRFPFSSESPLTSSDSELSPPPMYLDPAHMPSPRMLHALKMGQVPLTVVNDEREDESWATFIANHPDRGLSDKQSTSGPGNVSSTRSVTGTMSFTEAIHNREWSRGNSFVEQIGSHRIEFERSSTCCGYDRIILYFFCLVSALVLSVVPSLYLANYIMGTETLLSFDIIVTHTFVTLSIWGVSIMLAFFLILAIYSIIASCRNCYRRRKASLEEAVLFARETMPGYGSANRRVGVMAFVRQNSTNRF